MNTQEIKRGEYNAYYPISELKMAKMNRDLTISHVESFKSKLNDFGWMMPVVVSKKGDVIEGHNRIECAKLLNQKTIPAYVINWVDTNEEKEHLKAIISLNNGNKAWNTTDYLKAFARDNTDYRKAYDSHIKNTNNISVGNVANCFFGKTKGAGFKKGESKIIDLKFSLYLVSKISNLVQKHGKRKIQAYCVREMINIGFTSAKRDIKTMDFLFKKYDKLAQTNNGVLTSISEFKPTIETMLTNYK
tara:strand:+ start:60 stop:797 length:738 start_codon:yes stop_codon:yes gene_type:complete